MKLKSRMIVVTCHFIRLPRFALLLKLLVRYATLLYILVTNECLHRCNTLIFKHLLTNSFFQRIKTTECLLDAHPEAASNTNNYGNLALHFTAWKKGPLDVEKLLLKVYPGRILLSPIDLHPYLSTCFQLAMRTDATCK